MAGPGALGVAVASDTELGILECASSAQGVPLPRY